MIILDTNVVSELMRARPEPSVAAWVESVHRPATTAICVQELWLGIELLGGSSRALELQRRFELILERALSATVLPLTGISARHAAMLVAHRRRLGAPIGISDAQIAGIALEHGATLATRNTRDFVGMRLSLVNPWEPRR